MVPQNPPKRAMARLPQWKKMLPQPLPAANRCLKRRATSLCSAGIAKRARKAANQKPDLRVNAAKSHALNVRNGRRGPNVASDRNVLNAVQIVQNVRRVHNVRLKLLKMNRSLR